ncbi:bifunctional nuclease family protein [Corynebacterium lizhenjunii]|uniref:Bifunctional nuclease family protein n=1 Tax=Corynebacterium lizhenjunii TaxID=2709394 RepID=A0A7T0KGH8_9CORY|nr:DUF151 domain-containing protein [Corynebacterium lizhenjunii]QPK80159.1 bifunctional nuclease family protein [Corynebacterium lizhenjunii]
MTLRKLELVGVKEDEMETVHCFVFVEPEEQLVIPVWASGYEPYLAEVYLKGEQDNRYRAIDALLRSAEAMGGVESVNMSIYERGRFFFTVRNSDGLMGDMAVSEAVIMADHFGAQFTIEETLLKRIGVYTTPEELEEYLDTTMPKVAKKNKRNRKSKDSAGAAKPNDFQADRDFADLMRSLGVEEDDFDVGE